MVVLGLIQLVEVGGLAIIWKAKIDFELSNYSLRHRSGWVYDKGQRSRWLMTGFYGYFEAGQRQFVLRFNVKAIL